MKWYEISREKPQNGQLVWFSRPTRKNRIPILVRAAVPAGVRYGMSCWSPLGSTNGLAMRPTDQWAALVVPYPPRLLRST